MSKNMLDGCPKKLYQRTKDKLIEIVKDKALEFGTFVLKTGEKKSYNSSHTSNSGKAKKESD